MATDRTRLFSHYESRTVFAPPKRACLPVTIVTGFLGSGKTTLLNHILTNKQQLRVAALVNDYASLNIDKELVASNDNADGVVGLTNGCLCCTLEKDAEASVWSILEGNHPLLDAGGTDVDYLVVETSGVADPVSLVTALDRQFGKMTRVRLDSVVTVVDADALFHKITAGEELGVAFTNQLECADVVLLNKTELLLHGFATEELGKAALAKVCTVLTALAPAAVVHHTNYSRIALSHILDVVAVEEDGAVVSHEGAIRPLLVRSDGAGSLRVAVAKRSGAKKTDMHLAKDGYVSTTYQREGRLSLCKFQVMVAGQGAPYCARLLNAEPSKGAAHSHDDGHKHDDDCSCDDKPDAKHEEVEAGHSEEADLRVIDRLTRAKGEVCFVEDASAGGLFQLSGRRRLEYHPSALKHAGAPSVRLALIGKHLTKPLVDRFFAQCLSTEADTGIVGSGAAVKRVKTLIESDKRLEVVEREGLPSHVVEFWITCAREFNSTVEEMDALRGMNFPVANEAFLRIVNSSGKCFLTCSPPQGKYGIAYLRYAVTSPALWGGEGEMDTFFESVVWPCIVASADHVVSSYFRGARMCLCGF